MTLKDFFETLAFSNNVIVQGNPCGWCNEEMRQFVNRDDYKEYFEDYLDCEITSIDVVMEDSGYYCGEIVEVPVIEIEIE